MLRHEKASQTNIVILKWGRTHTIRRNSMPFIVYFFSFITRDLYSITNIFPARQSSSRATWYDCCSYETLFTSICLSRLLYELLLAKTDKSKKEILFLPCLFQSLWVSDPLLFTSSVSYDPFVDHLGFQSGRIILYVHLSYLKKI